MKKEDLSTSRIRDLFGDQKEIPDNELNDLRKVYDKLMDEDIPEPPDSLDERFYSLLESETGNKKIFFPGLSGFIRSESFRRISLIAAGISLFVLGWFGASMIGSDQDKRHNIEALTAEVAGLKESLVLTLLSKESPSDRIQAVNMVSEMNKVDKKIISGMLSTLNNDPNDNVRLVALETLVSYIEHPEVREGLIRSISKQDSPMIQYRLAEIMESLEEKKSVPEFQKILTDLTLDYSVRKRINETIEVLL